MPRPTKYNATIADRILNVLRAGNTRTTGALLAGIDYSTLKRWAASNAQFCAALDRAEAEAESRCVTQIIKAIEDGSTTDAKWWLERRRYNDWRPRSELTGRDGGPIEIRQTVDDTSALLLADLIAEGLAARSSDISSSS